MSDDQAHAVVASGGEFVADLRRIIGEGRGRAAAFSLAQGHRAVCRRWKGDMIVQAIILFC